MTSQADLELRMAELGRARSLARLNKMKAAGLISETSSGRHLLRDQSLLFTEAYREWHANGGRVGDRGRKSDIFPLLAPLEPEIVATTTVRTVLDGLTSRETRGHLVRICRAIGMHLEDVARLAEAERADTLLFKQTGEKAKRFGDDRWTARRRLIRAYENSDTPLQTDWGQEVLQKVGYTLVGLMMQETSFVKIVQIGKGGVKKQNFLRMTDECSDWLKDADAQSLDLEPFYLPCVAVPLDWKTPFGGGYHTNEVLQRPLIRTWDKRYMAELCDTEMPEVYKAVNALQRTAWAVNEDVYDVVQALWASGATIADLPPRDDVEVPEKPLKYDPSSDESKAEYKTWARQARAAHGTNSRAQSHRMSVLKSLFVAGTMKAEGRFFMPHFLDFRGRMYPTPSFLEPQGNDLARGMLHFADGEPLDSPEAVHWWKVSAANHYGIDKVPFAQREQWVTEHHNHILLSAGDPTCYRWWSNADSPWQFLAFCMEYAKWCDDTDGFVSHLPCHQDGSNNGLQLFSLLMKDPVGAAATNVSPTTVPADIYQEVADKVTIKLMAAEMTPQDNEQEAFWAKRWLEFTKGKLDRKACKRPVMVLPYGGTLFSCHEYVMDWLDDELRKTGASDPFPSDRLKPSMFLAKLIWSAIDETVSSAQEAMGWLRSVAKQTVTDEVALRWHTPAGFLVKQGYEKVSVRQQRYRVGPLRVNGPVMSRTGQLDPNRAQNGISPNFIHSLDAACAQLTVGRLHDEGVRDFAMVHDSYGVHARFVPKLNAILREVHADVFEQDPLNDFHQQAQAQLATTLPDPPEQGTLDVRRVEDSPYFFA
tara:strand:+ start:8941 stop:11397 length:2457 start_codon:yes stop_codon:yes gene_type:complete